MYDSSGTRRQHARTGSWWTNEDREFAEFSDVAARTLRYDERIGLFTPV
jgi:hypothetical protein